MTDDERREEAEAEERFARIDRARDAVVREIGEWRKGAPPVAGYVACPVCKGAATLHFHRAGNGHIGAQCKTPGCVSWRE